MLICVTNRKLCKDDFLNRVNKISKGKPYGIMLREKDLNISEYEELALKIKEITQIDGVPLIINQNIEVALKLKISNIHLSMPNLRKHKNNLNKFVNIGASVHSIAEAKEAEKLGASYLIAGHIFATDCKIGIPPRGLDFLKEICESISIPVFAIGGITDEKIDDIRKTGASGVCIMSEAMTCLNPFKLTNRFF